MKKAKKAIVLLLIILFVISLGSCGKTKIKIPKKLKAEIQNQLSFEEQEILNNYVKELITSFNERDPIVKNAEGDIINPITPDNYLKKTQGYSNAEERLIEALKNNEILQTARNVGFVIDMDALFGMTPESGSTVPEDVIKEIEDSIKYLVEYYYD